MILHAPLLASRIIGMAPPTKPTRSPSPTYTLGNPGRPAEHSTLTTALFDDSYSLTGTAGGDPLSNRYTEVAKAFSVVARKGSRHELGAVLHFDTPTSGDIGPVPLTWPGLLRLRSGLRVPPDSAGSSELGPSLHRAVEIAEAHPDHAATLVVLSDFQLCDPDPAQVLSDLADFPGDVHAVVLGTPLAAGVLDERITVTHVGRDDPSGAVAHALFASLTTHRPGSHPGQTSTDGRTPRRLVSWIPQRISRTSRDETGGYS